MIDANAEKAPAWFTSRGLQLPKLVQTITDAYKNSIPHPEESVNTFDENSSDNLYSLGEAENGDIRENERLKAENKKLEERVQCMRYRQFRKAVESGEMEAKVRKQELSDGDIFSIVEDGSYIESAKEKGKKTASHAHAKYWDYF